MSIIISCCHANDEQLKALVTLEPSLVNVGIVPFQGSAHAQIAIQNGGDTSFRITDIVAGCACTVNSIPTEAVKPGGAGVFELTYYASRYGNAEILVYVKGCFDGDSCTVVRPLRLLAQTPGNVVAEPSKILITRMTSKKIVNLHQYLVDGESPAKIVDIAEVSGFRVSVGQPLERQMGVASRAITIPINVELDGITLPFEERVLKIQVLVDDGERTIEIPIRSGVEGTKDG